ncbi:ATP synthase F1 subunit delta [Alicyclobacillus suci]|uniref:ATP synthase F1 subunit delta n=1 Tax=Alicyclobacillus suci TaxID=2816080 RepID=UPI001A909DBD|nr:ATP synthase F1 subunit delta [Alicyclobacillus suci]
MLSGAVINRYARGLLAYAKAHDVTDALDAQLGELGRALAASAELKALLANPVLTQEMKLSTIDKLFAGELRSDLRNFIALLLERQRGRYVSAIAERYHELVDELKGRLEVEIEAAQPLSEAQIEAIVARLSQSYGKAIHPVVRINPALLAGYRIQVGNRVLDATTQNQLRQFRSRLVLGNARKEGTR